MAKKSRKVSKQNPSLLAWPRVILIIIPLFAAVLIMFNTSNGRSVLGVSDTNLLNLNKEHRQATSSGGINCRSNRVIAFSVTTLCDSNRNGFKQVNYTCADGTSGTLSKNCINVQSAYEKALKACSKTSQCAKIEAKKRLTPKPTRTEPVHE